MQHALRNPPSNSILPRRRLCLGAAGAAALVLVGCGDPPPSASSTTPIAVSVDTLAAQAAGFSSGSTMASRVVYVFFDAQCPHCAILWDAAKPLKPQARFVWIPVALLSDKSLAQGGAILGAPDPVAAMDLNEASVRARQGGISAMGVDASQKGLVKKNTELFNRFGFTGVPTAVSQSQSGNLITIEGSLPMPALAQRLGLRVPGG